MLLSSRFTVPSGRGTESLAWKNLEIDGVGLEHLFLLGNSFSGIFLFLLVAVRAHEVTHSVL
jgi:hypothetical protein